MTASRVRIEIEFELPGGDQPSAHTLEECVGLVMHQMRASPKWDDPAGTGLLNYVCYDRTLRCVSARIVEEKP